MLCGLCQNIMFKPRAPPSHEASTTSLPSYIFVHQPDLKSLETSAEQGCHFCTQLWARLSQTPSRVISPFVKSKPKPPNPESESAQLYCEKPEDGKVPEALFAYSGRERSAAFEMVEFERAYILSSCWFVALYALYSRDVDMAERTERNSQRCDF